MEKCEGLLTSKMLQYRLKAGLLSGLIFLCLPLSFVQALLPQELSAVHFQNLTGFPIVQIFAQEFGTKSWGPDLLNGAKIPYGAVKSFFIHYADIESNYSFLAIDVNGNAYSLAKELIRDGASNLLTFNSSLKIEKSNMKFRNLLITNNSGKIITYLFCSPKNWKNWGPEVLQQNQMLMNGGTSQMKIPFDLDSFEFEILAVTKDHGVFQSRITYSKENPENMVLDLAKSLKR